MTKRAELYAWVAVTMWSAPLLAEPHVDRHHNVQLTWMAPDGCPQAHEVTEHIEKLLSNSVAPSGPLVAEANVLAQAGGFRLDLKIWQRERPFFRTVEATSCTELSDAAALILALLIDPELGARTGDSRATLQEPPMVTSSMPRAAFAPAREPSEGLTWGAFGGMAVDFGALPGLTPGLTFGVLSEVGRLRLHGGGAAFPLAKKVVADDSPQPKGGKFNLFAANVKICYRLLRDVDLGACAGGELGALSGSGFGTADDQGRTVLWGALGPGLQGSVPLAPAVSLALGADLLFAFNRPEFELDNVGPVYTPRLFSLRVALGVLLHFR